MLNKIYLLNAMHITASVFINDDESGLHHDYDVWLEKLAPHKPVSQYRHNAGEDNADAHMKRQIMGREVVVAVTNGPTRLRHMGADLLRRVRREKEKAGACKDNRRMKKLAVTMGDPGGIGPEVVVRALHSAEVRDICRPVVIGDSSVIKEALRMLNSPLTLRIIQTPKDSKPSKGTVEVIHVIPPLEKGGIITEGTKRGRQEITSEIYDKNRPTAKGGRASVSYIAKAVELVMNKTVAGIVTAPISKEALKMADCKWPGHTEMLADLTGTKDYAMMLTGGSLRVILVTIHTALKNVPDLITKQKIVTTIRLAKKACDMLGMKKPRIAVAGLNPHAGEAGMFGDEETRKIIPAIKMAAREGISVSGPYPPDTVFHKAYKGEVDIIVCMYHDQGLIPLKMIAFDTGVNVTVGLPFVRTSPDHGTAYDIAWKGTADPSSMIEAIKLAVRLRI